MTDYTDYLSSSLALLRMLSSSFKLPIIQSYLNILENNGATRRTLSNQTLESSGVTPVTRPCRDRQNDCCSAPRKQTNTVSQPQTETCLNNSSASPARTNPTVHTSRRTETLHSHHGVKFVSRSIQSHHEHGVFDQRSPVAPQSYNMLKWSEKVLMLFFIATIQTGRDVFRSQILL